MLQAEHNVSYFVDANDRITGVSGPWDAFALENDGPGACADAVVGKSLADFIAGDVSLMFIRTMLMSARTLQRSVYRPYRCDSDKLKRYMEMTVIPRPDGGLEVRHRMLYSEAIRHRQQRPTTKVADPKAPRVKRCTMCNKVHVANAWYEVEDALQLGVLVEERSNGPWIFGVCPSCLERCGAVL